MNSEIRNIAVLAHVDAGKTSFCEQILFYSGEIKESGSVDHGNTFSDSLQVEKDRGISVRSSVFSVQYGEIKLNIVDTPGHVDFSADVQRILQVVDAAILIISAADSLQAHTETLWNALQKREIPVLLLLNKIDRESSDAESLIAEMKREWNIDPLLLQNLHNEGSSDCQIETRWSSDLMSEDIVEQIVSQNDDLMESYLEGNIPKFDILDQQMKTDVSAARILPVLYSSAKMALGIEEVLEFCAKYFPVPTVSDIHEFSARVFALDQDKNLGKMAFVRVFSGKTENRQPVFNKRTQKEEKPVQIRRIAGTKFEDINELNAGEIGVLYALGEAQVEDILGSGDFEVPEVQALHTALLSVQVKADDDKDYTQLAAAMQKLNEEDPSLELDWDREEQELHVKICGWIQMEVMERMIEDRFNIKAHFENPTVIYKETPSKKTTGFVRYWMPKPCWAILKFEIEPAERGSGVHYESLISVDDVARKYQNEVEETIEKSLKQGIKGWEVTDLNIRLIEGEDHEVHSHPGDFKIATPMGIMNGLQNGGTTLLEPILSFVIKADEDLLGAVSSDIIKMRGTFESPMIQEGRFILKGRLPLATSQDYAVKLSSRSGGRASISTSFLEYCPCTDEEGVMREYRGISPLDEAKWILKARGAMQ
ncbi:MAG: TetM/TetW/TetO/TetS family tetracycline resistance ribosomal protection protein [Bacteroidales bacterium]|nr:TetM/TetW/TetO/TetS family tetracycline resistance ribosomal protection protein [Bacteroidales bacterium]